MHIETLMREMEAKINELREENKALKEKNKQLVEALKVIDEEMPPNLTMPILKTIRRIATEALKNNII